jgi:hypothetical protein
MTGSTIDAKSSRSELSATGVTVTVSRAIATLVADHVNAEMRAAASPTAATIRPVPRTVASMASALAPP